MSADQKIFHGAGAGAGGGVGAGARSPLYRLPVVLTTTTANYSFDPHRTQFFGPLTHSRLQMLGFLLVALVAVTGAYSAATPTPGTLNDRAQIFIAVVR